MYAALGVCNAFAFAVVGVLLVSGPTLTGISGGGMIEGSRCGVFIGDGFLSPALSSSCRHSSISPSLTSAYSRLRFLASTRLRAA